MGAVQLENPVKRALLERTLTLGTWIQLGNAGVSEIMANAGFDWIAVDCEHTNIGLGDFSHVVRGMYGRGAVPFVRVSSNETLAIRQALDNGAMGIIVPLVNSAEEAAQAVASAKFPPDGIRGFAYFRANEYGVGFDEYVQRANDDIAVVVMIESRQAVESIDAILEVKGVDGVFIGPYDLSGSYGLTGKVEHPIIAAACKRVSEACRRHGKSAGIHIVQPSSDAVKRALDEGFTFIALGMDTVFLANGCMQALGMAEDGPK